MLRLKEEKSDGVKARTILWYMAFFGFAMNYVIRINLSIAIVDMIDSNYKKSNTLNKTIATSECIVNEHINNNTNQVVPTNLEVMTKKLSIEQRLLELFEFEFEKDGFKWDEYRQQQVLGSFYWTHWMTQLLGGVLAKYYGTKLIFGLANFVPILLCAITPISCYIDYRLVILLRIITGAFSGLAWPAMHQLAGKWIPGNERSRFVSAFLGSSIGCAITFPIFGYIIKISSWENVFHATFIIGSIWFILWQFLVFDSPEEHPRIHPAEKGYILQVLGSSVIRKGEKEIEIPWKDILTSKCILILIITQFGSIYGITTLLIQTPVYLRSIHGWGIEVIGLASGIPHLSRSLFAIIFSKFCDFLLTQEKMTRVNVRKFATFFHLVLNGGICLGLAYAGCNSIQAAVFLFLSLTFHGAMSSGVLPGIIDNAPNFSGILYGVSTTIAMMSGFISSIIVGYFTYENQTVEAWQHIFEINSLIMIISGLCYIFFQDGSLQKWNNPRKAKDAEKEEEVNRLNYES